MPKDTRQVAPYAYLLHATIDPKRALHIADPTRVSGPWMNLPARDSREGDRHRG